MICLLVDGRIARKKKMAATFWDSDWENLPKMADRIIQAFKDSHDHGVYDIPVPEILPGMEISIEFSPNAKEWFSFLREHATKLLDLV